MLLIRVQRICRPRAFFKRLDSCEYRKECIVHSKEGFQYHWRSHHYDQAGLLLLVLLFSMVSSPTEQFYIPFSSLVLFRIRQNLSNALTQNTVQTCSRSVSECDVGIIPLTKAQLPATVFGGEAELRLATQSGSHRAAHWAYMHIAVGITIVTNQTHNTQAFNSISNMLYVQTDFINLDKITPHNPLSHKVTNAGPQSKYWVCTSLHKLHHSGLWPFLPIAFHQGTTSGIAIPSH